MKLEDIFKILDIEKLTDSQKKAVLEEKMPILISASAGSGKTFILTKRYIYKILKSSNIDTVQKILVLTFAKSAAFEMFKRIKDEISKISEKNENKKLIKIKDMLSKNLITTIDSFCYGVIKENFELCKISPNFTIVSNLEIKKLKENILNLMFEKEYNKNKEKFQKLLDYLSLSSDDELKDSILKIYEKSKTMPFPKEYIKNLEEEFKTPKILDKSEYLKEIKDDIKDKLEEIKNLLNMAIDSFYDDLTGENFKPSLEKTIENAEKIEKEIDNLNYEETEKIIDNFKFESFKRYDKKKNAFDRELAEEIKKLYINKAKKIKESLKENIVNKEQYTKDFEEQKEFAEYLIKLTIKFYKKLEIEKRKKNILEFSDLIIKTIEIFVEKEENKKFKLTPIGKIYSLKFEEILIDEFQDINRSQDILIKILSNNDRKLFMVGDIKQSIYGFRDADTKIFLERKNNYELNPSIGNLIYLNKNFRSVKEVTNSVNLLFSQIMTKDFGGINYKETENLISNKTTQIKNSNTELHILKNESDLDNKEFELIHIAKTIRNMLDNKFKILKNDELVECNEKDFAILFRSSKDSAKTLSEKLRELKINYISFEDINCFKSFEILILISILKILDNISLDLPFYSVATSPLFNFTKEEMLEIKIKNKNKPFFFSFKNSKDKKCKDMIYFLDSLKKNLQNKKLDELIEEIYNKDYFLKIFTKVEFDETKIRNKEIFLNIARNYTDYSKYSISGFLSYIEDISSEKIEIVDKKENSKNAVTITTIHKSKGLEWPIVFIPQTKKLFNEEDFKKPILLSLKFKLTLKHSKKELLTRYNTLPFNAATIFERKKQKEEELRLLYVAMTRAKFKLILTAVDSKEIIKKTNTDKFKELNFPASFCRNKKSYFEWILPAFLRNKKITYNQNLNCDIEIKTEFKDEIKEKYNEPVKEKDLTNILKSRIIKVKNIKNTLPTKMSVTEIVNFNNENKETFKLKIPNFRRMKETALEKGIAMHNFLQYVNFKNAEKNLNLEIERLVKKEFITKDQSKILDRKKLKNFFFSYTYKLIKTADRIEREKSFFYEIDSNIIFKNIKKHKILIQGIVDCIIFKKNKLILIDYKTDETTKKHLILRYQQQLKIYEYALEKIFKKPVEFSIIHSIFLNRAIKI